MTTYSRSGKSGVEILEAVRIECPKIVELLSLGCGRKMGWGNNCNCHIRHLCYYCQAVRAEISRHELEEMMLRVEETVKGKSRSDTLSQVLNRNPSDADLIERIQRYMKEAQI